MSTNGQTETAKARRKNPVRFDQVWIDASGNKVDKIEDATGGRVSVDGNAAISFDWQVPDGNARLWSALFGLRTVITNEISAAFQSGELTAQGQLALAQERLALIFAGEQFVDRSREGGGFRVNVEALCNAIADVQVKAKKLHRDARDAKVAELIGKVTDTEEGKALAGKPLKFWLSAPGVRDHYDLHLGKSVASLDDLGSI